MGGIFLQSTSSIFFQLQSLRSPMRKLTSTMFAINTGSTYLYLPYSVWAESVSPSWSHVEYVSCDTRLFDKYFRDGYSSSRLGRRERRVVLHLDIYSVSYILTSRRSVFFNGVDKLANALISLIGTGVSGNGRGSYSEPASSEPAQLQPLAAGVY